MGFLGSSAGKEFACNTGDPGSIPGLGRSAGDGIGYPLQYSWASLVAQLVKNLPTMQETWVWSLGWEDPLEKWKATHSSILTWRIRWTVYCFHILTIVNDTAVNIDVRASFWISVFFFSNINPGVELLGHMIIFLFFWDTSTLFSTFYIPTHGIWRFPFLPSLTILVICVLFDDGHLTSVRWNLM